VEVSAIIKKEASYYEKEGAACRCLLCPHACLIADGGAGLCRARAAEGGKLYAISYGAAASLALDPIEKKPLYRFHPGSRILSYGSYGCNMRCAWCQNASISQYPPPWDAPSLTPEELTRQAIAAAGISPEGQKRDKNNRPLLSKTIVDDDASPERQEQDKGNRPLSSQNPGDGNAAGAPTYPKNNIGVAFTYNEPLVSPEFILDTAPRLRAAGLATVLVTNAMIHEAPFADVLRHADAMNIDLKGFSEGMYERNGGSLNVVKRNIETAAGSPNCPIEITTLIVPGENDTQEEMQAEAEWIATLNPEIPLHITRFFPRHKTKSKNPTPIKTIEALTDTAKQYLKHVYPGNL
jgi:pyruvate formate lyase activating enzyme